VCQSIIGAYLGFAHTNLQIYRLMERGDPTISSTLIHTSNNMVNVVLELGAMRRKYHSVHSDLSYLVLCYGLPPVVVLVEALQKIARHGTQSVIMPDGLTRSSIIRTLSVFVTQLETASEPVDTNYKVCIQASGAITTALDEVIDAPVVAKPVQALQSQTGQAGDGLVEDFSMTDLDPDLWNDTDLASWVKSLDWSSSAAEWSSF
jgi:hypothetical protein